VIVTVISISHFLSALLIPNEKCIAWNFDGSNMNKKNKNLEKLRFENGDIIPDIESYFVN
jgi:hypothetical protein